MDRLEANDLSTCTDAFQAALTEYVDGELSFDEQPGLFVHLAACADCRRTLESVMAFRRIVREEHLTVPPAADDAFLRRLNEHQRVTGPAARTAADVPWTRHGLVSVRTLVVVALVVFLVGLFAPMSVSSDHSPLAWVEMREERVHWGGDEAGRGQAVYVFYPGVTVEAPRYEAVPADDL